MRPLGAALVLGLAVGAAGMTLPDLDVCRGHQCRAGRECLEVGGRAECLCLAACPDHDRPVCGSDGRSYDNHCRLHQRACVTGNHIRVSYRGYCTDDIELALKEFGVTTDLPITPSTTTTTTTTTPAPPAADDDLAVCYGAQRDALRDAAIRGWREGGRGEYEASLPGHFASCDTDSDGRLRPDELLDCLPGGSEGGLAEEDLVTRTLCIDALVEGVDTNLDWRLDLTEFSLLLDPLYHPPQRNCSLEGRSYTDGARVAAGCNHCVCATGSWVCATRTCSDRTSASSKPAEKSENGVMKDEPDNDEDYYDDDDDLYEDNEVADDYKDESIKEQSKKEYNWLTPIEKKRLNYLEDNIKKFYKKFNETSDVNEKSDEVDNSIMDSVSDDDLLEDDEEESLSEEEEDDLLDDYDDLLDKSEKIRDELHILRDTIREIEEKRALRKKLRQSRPGVDEDLHTNAIPRGGTEDKTEHSDRKTALLAKLERDRQRALTSTAVWEDQWKAKIKKHRHTLYNSNHL